MAQDGMAPAAEPDNSFLSQQQNVSVHLQNRHNELLAQLRFMGLLAGIKGPNGTKKDVKEARDSIIEALSDFLSVNANPLANQIRQEMAEQKQMRGFENLYERFPNNDEHLVVSEGLERLLSNYSRNIFGRANLDNLANGGSLRVAEEYIRQQSISGSAADYIRQSALKYQKTAGLEIKRGELSDERLRQWWASIWDGLKSYYNARMAEIHDGRLFEAMAKVTIDAGYIIAEELIYAGMITAIVALTGGAAIAVAAGLRVALSFASRSARLVAVGAGRVSAAGRQAADTVIRVRISKVIPDVQPGSARAGKQLHTRDIDVETDLTPDEARAFGEGGQGSTRPDADAPEQGQNVQRDNDVADDDGPNARTTPRRDIDCFDVPNGVDRGEFDRQLREQQDTINNMTADEMAYAHTVLDQARQRWRELGRKGSFTNLVRDPAAQNLARRNHLKLLENAEYDIDEIRDIMSNLDATHFLDLIAGGDPKRVGTGGSAENRRIGPAWAFTNTPSGVSRAEMLRNEANRMRTAGRSNQKMNVGLSSCN